jgi:ABC-type dipeptide/oligopeptide/nickel transport system permease component
MIAVIVVSFMVMRFTPGGPFDREKPIPDNILMNLRAQYRLDRPMLPVWTTPTERIEKKELEAFASEYPAMTIGDVHFVYTPRAIGETQLFAYFGQILRGDFGVSMKFTQVTVNDILRRTFPVSFTLGFFAFLLTFVLGVGLGTLAAWRKGTWVDAGAMVFATFGFSMPNFVLGALLILVFSLWLGWLPPALWEGPLYAILPIVTLALAPAAYIARLTRSGLLEALDEDYIRTARAKGVREKAVVFKHALVNALGPLITVGGPLLAMLVTGSFIVELIFSIPGMGRYFITAVIDRDYPLVMGVTVTYALLIVIANIVVDLLYAIVDPRVEL